MHVIKKEESLSQKRVVLSLGRLHPLKGLDLLIAAWAEVKRSALVRYCDSALVEREGEVTVGSGSRQLEEDGGKSTNALMNYRTNELLSWQLVIAGPDEQGTLDKLKGLSEKLKMKWCECADGETRDTQADIIFVGPVQGEAKWDLIKRADIFVLPSRSENFGIVVGEALSCGVPVVTTAVGPWGEGEMREFGNSGMRECGGEGSGERRVCENVRMCEGDGKVGASCSSPVLMEKRGLIVVETSFEGIAEGLEQMMALSDDERHEMGRKGSEWVKREFSWDHVAKQMVAVYEEVR